MLRLFTRSVQGGTNENRYQLYCIGEFEFMRQRDEHEGVESSNSFTRTVRRGTNEDRCSKVLTKKGKGRGHTRLLLMRKLLSEEEPGGDASSKAYALPLPPYCEMAAAEGPTSSSMSRLPLVLSIFPSQAPVSVDQRHSVFSQQLHIT